MNSLIRFAVPVASVLSGLLTATTAVAQQGSVQKATTLDITAYEQLKALAGDWQGRIDDPQKGQPVQIRYAVQSGGKAVFEHLFPGTDHEMVTVYYLAYDRLQATHYCAIGNQPAYALSPKSTPTDIAMDFAGGTGFDPTTDQHACGVQVSIRDADRIEVRWNFNKGDVPNGSKLMYLERVKVPAAG
jgi:hypothetical protein